MASSDSPCSALSVIYSDEGVVQGSRFHRKNADLVLVDTQVIAQSPPRLLVAGMGDALATWFEAKTCVDGGVKNLRGGLSTQSALAGGKTFSAAAQMGSGNWKLDGCPMDGGWLASTATGKVTSVWRRNTEIFRTDTARGGEQLLGSGEQPWVAGTSTGAYVVWLSKRNGDLWLAAPKSRQPLKLADGATDPVIVAPTNGKGPVVAAWEAGQRGSTSIMAAVVAE